MRNIPQFQPNNTQIVQNQPLPIQTNAQSNIVWVQGENAAKSYPVAPNNTVLLMDSEQHIFYWKSADQNGMPLQLQKFKYEEIVENASTSENKEKEYTDTTFATKDDIEEIKGEIEQIKSDINKKPVKTTKKVENEDE